MSDDSNQLSVTAAVGERLRRLREARQLSLSELARRARIGKATLSELESGQRNPTLETLYALTTALEVPLSAAIPRVGEGETEALRGAAVDAVLVARFDDTEATTELYRLAIRHGRRQTSPAHAAGVTEHLIVFAGTAVVGPATAPLELDPGASGAWPADVEHVYSTLGDEDVSAALLIRYPTGAPTAR